MAKVDKEILTMSRIKKLLLKHDYQEQVRITTWLASVACELSGQEAPQAPSPRQVPMFGEA